MDEVFDNLVLKGKEFVQSQNNTVMAVQVVKTYVGISKFKVNDHKKIEALETFLPLVEQTVGDFN